MYGAKYICGYSVTIQHTSIAMPTLKNRHNIIYLFQINYSQVLKVRPVKSPYQISWIMDFTIIWTNVHGSEYKVVQITPWFMNTYFKKGDSFSVTPVLKLYKFPQYCRCSPACLLPLRLGTITALLLIRTTSFHTIVQQRIRSLEMWSPCAQQLEYSLPCLLEVYQNPWLESVSISRNVQHVSPLEGFTVFYFSNGVFIPTIKLVHCKNANHVLYFKSGLV